MEERKNYFTMVEESTITEIRESMLSMANSIEELAKRVETPRPEQKQGLTKMIPRKELAKHFSTTPKTIDDWVKYGVLHQYKLGGKIYFKSDEVEQVINQSRICN